MPDPAVEPTLGVDRVAVILGVSRPTVYAAIKSGELYAIRTGRQLAVPTAWLRKHLHLDDAAPSLTADMARSLLAELVVLDGLRSQLGLSTSHTLSAVRAVLHELADGG